MTSSSTEPLPRVLGYSPKDEIAAIGFFLGAPNNPEKLKDYGEHHAATFHLPDAYQGSNVKLRDTLNNLVLHAPQQWQTEVALPFRKVEGTTVEWDTIQFNVGLMARVPPEGVSRMQTALRRHHRARVVRRGIGLMIESDFYATEAGRKHFTDQLTSIRYCVQETCNFDVLYAYLACDNYDFRYDIMKGLRSRRSIKTAMHHDLMMYGIVQKQGLGFDRAVEESKCRMSRYQVTPDMIVVPPQLLLYIAMSPEEKIRYSEGGSTAVTRFEDGKKGYETRSFRGLGVFESLPYEVGSDEESMQLLQRNTQVGEFYRMSPPSSYDESVPLPSCYMDIIVYDENADQHVHLTFYDAASAALISSKAVIAEDPCGLFEWLVNHAASEYHENLINTLPPGPAIEFACSDLIPYAHEVTGSSYQPSNLKVASGGFGTGNGSDVDAHASRKILKTWVTTKPTVHPLAVLFGRAVVYAIKMGELSKIETLVALMEKATTGAKVADLSAAEVDGLQIVYELFVDLAGAGIWVPMGITVARPFIEHTTMSTVLAKSGEDTGVTLFGPADMQISANTSVKTVEGHYTCNTKAIVSKPQNVLVMRDIMCTGYVAGSNTIYFGAANKKRVSRELPAQGVVGDLTKSEIKQRLDGEEDTTASMMAFFVPFDEDEGHRDTVISVANRSVPWEADASTTNDTFPGGARGWEAYKDVLGLVAIHQGEDPFAMGTQDYFATSNSANSLCFLGPHRKFNPWSTTGFQLVTGQGHFGADAIPGDARWRRGEMVSLESARNSVVSLELAAQSQMAFRPRNSH